MLSFLLGFLSSIIIREYLKPKPVVICNQQILDLLKVNQDEEMRQFSTVIDGVRFAWDIEKLWIEFESMESIDWEIPSTFKEEWSWGQSHPSEHIERCIEADLSFPILVWDGSIIDGCHRAVKSISQGQKTIKAKIISDIPPPDVQTEADPKESNKDVPWNYGDMIRITRAIIEYEEVQKYKYRHPADGI